MIRRIALTIVFLFVGLVLTSSLGTGSSDAGTNVEQGNNPPQRIPEGDTPIKTVKPYISSQHKALPEVNEKPKSVSSQKTHETDKLFIQGKDAIDNGNLEEAIEIWEKAVKAYDFEKEPAKQMDVLSRLAVTYQHLGHYSKSLDKLKSALELSGNINDRNRLAVIYGGFGQYYYLTGELNKSKDYFVKGLLLAKETGGLELAADILNNYANFMAAQQHSVEAIDAYKECVNLAERVNRSDLSVRAKINMSRVYIDQNMLADAKLLLEDAFKKLSGLHDTYNKIYDFIAISRLMNRIYLKSPETDILNRAYNALQSAEAIAGKLTNRRASSYALGYLGALYEQGKRYDDALLLTNRAILAAQQANATESLYRWYWQQGRISRKRGNIDEAITNYRHALQSLRAIRLDVSAACSQRAQISFREAAGPVYFELADILLQRSASQRNTEQAKHDLFEARNTVEQLKGAELQDYFQDDCVVALKIKTKNLEQIIQQTAVVYFILLPNRIELLVTLPSGLKQFTVPISIEPLNSEVIAFRNSLERSEGNYLQNAQKLYEWLIRPLEKTLIAERIETLIFVPDGMLRTIPMGALHDGECFLISKYTVVTTPGITLMDPHPISRENSKLLLGGLSEAVQGFSALPNVTAELQNIQKLYGSVIYQDRDFINANIEKAMKGTPYNVIHIASHGQFDRDPQKTFLLTYNDKLSMNQLERLIAQGRFRDQAVELLTLSACQTAVGDDRAALGLAGIAIKAGARSALASLWSINDEATSQLMVEFYRHLQSTSNSKAKALQLAQQKMLSDERFHHPAYWAPFILIGNWL
ncbi:MAG: CHAT domain-containing protein [Desulfobacteraceae bacterium]|nr:MAG: CHAT domain-containing protein [Desulfobacteraceae bacterium]